MIQLIQSCFSGAVVDFNSMLHNSREDGCLQQTHQNKYVVLFGGRFWTFCPIFDSEGHLLLEGKPSLIHFVFATRLKPFCLKHPLAWSQFGCGSGIPLRSLLGGSIRPIQTVRSDLIGCKNENQKIDFDFRFTLRNQFFSHLFVRCSFPKISVQHPLHVARTPVHAHPKKVYSSVEKIVVSAGRTHLANLMRILRLMNPYAVNSTAYKVWNEQAQLNIPILILASLYLDEFCKTHQKNRLFFSARGCCHLFELFKHLFPQYESYYFFTSRNVYNEPSSEYIQYVKSIYVPDKTVIVDEHGCGITCQNFFMKHFSLRPCYISITKFSGPDCGVSLVQPGSDKIERINYAQEGSLAGYDAKGPVRVSPEYNVSLLSPAFACVQKCVEIMKGHTFGTFDQKLLETLLHELDVQGAVLSNLHQAFHAKVVLEKAS